jgi:hypothetical protein
MLPLQLVVGIIVLVLKLTMELGVLPRVEPLRVSLSMLFLNLIMNVAMLVIELIMLLIVASVIRIAVVAVGVRVAIAWVPIARIAVAISRPDRDREAAMQQRLRTEPKLKMLQNRTKVRST